MDFLCFQKFPLEIYLPTTSMWLQSTHIKLRYIKLTFCMRNAVTLFFPLRRLKSWINLYSQNCTNIWGNLNKYSARSWEIRSFRLSDALESTYYLLLGCLKGYRCLDWKYKILDLNFYQKYYITRECIYNRSF